MVEKTSSFPLPSDFWSQVYSPFRTFGERVAEFFSPSSEAASTEDAYEVTVELPGVAEDDITVEVHDGQLTVMGEKQSHREEKDKNYFFSERTYGSFRRAFRLPADADPAKVTAHHKDGVLEIHIPKVASAEPSPRKIEVKSG